jgi:hypothetical protein
MVITNQPALLVKGIKPDDTEGAGWFCWREDNTVLRHSCGAAATRHACFEARRQERLRESLTLKSGSCVHHPQVISLHRKCSSMALGSLSEDTAGEPTWHHTWCNIQER